MAGVTRILIHHHAITFVENERIWIQSFIGIWVQELSHYFAEIGLLVQESDSRREEQDFPITAKNVVVHRLNPSYKCNRLHRNRFMRKVCKKVSPNYGLLLIRGITPRQKLVFDSCVMNNKYYLLVGSLVESEPDLHFNKFSIITWLMFWLRRYEIRKISKSAFMLANSPLVAQEIESILGTYARFVPTNSIRKKDFIKFGIRNMGNPVKILFCGRVVNEKGIEELIESISMLNDINVFVTLDIVGKVSEAYKSFLADKIHGNNLDEKIRFHGFVPFGVELLQFYRNSDIYVLPSRHEGFPHSIWEAAASCTPIIVSSVGGIPGLVSDEEVFLIRPKNVKVLVDAIIRVIKEPEERIMKVKKAYQLALNYTTENCVKNIAEVIKLHSKN